MRDKGEMIMNEKPVFNVNGKAVEVTSIDFDSVKGCFVMDHPCGSSSEYYVDSGEFRTPLDLGNTLGPL